MGSEDPPISDLQDILPMSGEQNPLPQLEPKQILPAPNIPNKLTLAPLNLPAKQPQVIPSMKTASSERDCDVLMSSPPAIEAPSYTDGDGTSRPLRPPPGIDTPPNLKNLTKFNSPAAPVQSSQPPSNVEAPPSTSHTSVLHPYTEPSWPLYQAAVLDMNHEFNKMLGHPPTEPGRLSPSMDYPSMLDPPAEKDRLPFNREYTSMPSSPPEVVQLPSNRGSTSMPDPSPEPSQPPPQMDHTRIHDVHPAQPPPPPGTPPPFPAQLPYQATPSYISPCPQIVRLSMDFFPPPLGTVKVLSGFDAYTPKIYTRGPPKDILGTSPLAPIEEHVDEKLRTFISEHTSHSMITVAGAQKLPQGTFRWMGRPIRCGPIIMPPRERYFFTSVVGDIEEEDRKTAEEAVTGQLVVEGTVDLYFKVKKGSAVALGVSGDDMMGYHYFHMHVLLVRRFYPVQMQPAILTAKQKEEMGVKKDPKLYLAADRNYGFELCLGQDFLQSYPHLLFDVMPTPAAELRISSIYDPCTAHPPPYGGGGQDILSIYTAGAIIVRRGTDGSEELLGGGLGVYFAPQSVYNTFCRMPKGNQRESLAGGPNAVGRSKISLGRADLASAVLALEMVIMLSRLNLPTMFRKVYIYHKCNMLCKENRDQMATFVRNGHGYCPNMDLMQRLNQLQRLIERAGDITVDFIYVKDHPGTEPALGLAIIGASMEIFNGSPDFGETRMCLGTEHPLQEGVGFTAVPHGLYSTSSMKLAPFDSTVAMRKDGTFPVPGNLTVRRAPKFLSFGNTQTYELAKGRPIAYTLRVLYMVSKENVARLIANPNIHLKIREGSILQ